MVGLYVQIRDDYLLSHYIQQKKFDDAKRFALAAQLSDLFDQYQIYRHVMIQDWTDKKNDNPSFQEYLWKALKNKLGDITRGKVSVDYKMKFPR